MLFLFFLAQFSFSGKSISITSQNLDEITNNTKKMPIFIKFWSPYCPHCKAFEPIWNEFSKKSDFECIIADVNCIDQSKVCQKFQIESYPTIKWIHPSQNIEIEYFNDRSLESLLSFVKARLSPHFILVTGEREISDQKSEKNIYVFGYKTKNDKIFDNVVDVSKEFNKVNIPVLAIPASSNHLTFHEYDGTEKFEDKKFKKDNLRKFFQKHIFSFFNEMKPEFISQFHTLSKPVILYFLLNQGFKKHFLRINLNQLKSKYHFLYTNYNQTDGSIRDLFTPYSKTESFLVFIDPKSKKYISSKAHLSEGDLLSWIKEEVENDKGKEKWKKMFPSRFTVDGNLIYRNKNLNKKGPFIFNGIIYFFTLISACILIFSIYLGQCNGERSPGQPIVDV
ncbi:hypothetical protein M9Y10_022965 [Tritrichomonas musculus]|uniref:Thioredoxin domain-containing protein n=1 Tax=Tritrichomonas musculus TaxID=1915356 RepID=A0ABR2KUT0_9EUKA